MKRGLGRRRGLALIGILLLAGITAEAKTVVRVESQAEVTRMEAYLHSLYDRYDVRHSFRQPSGDEIDCVDIDKQPALRRPEMRGQVILTPPPLSPKPNGLPNTEEGDADAPRLAAPEPLTGELDEDGAERKCPQSTIPIRRITLDDLKRFRSLEDFHRKYPDPGPPPSGADIPPASGSTAAHQYAHATRYNLTNYGAHSVFNLWNPGVQPGADAFSLSQLWVMRGVGSSLETLEGGIQVFPNKYGDGNARLFIYSTSDGYAGTGFAHGCYNLDCGRFVQTNSSIVVGGRFPAYSVTAGVQQEVEISFVRGGSPTAAWWLLVNGVWLGYYPLTLFDAYGVRYSADTIDFGGEIFDGRTSPYPHTTTDMGSSTGAYPSAWYRQAAYQRKLRYYSTPSTALDASGLISMRTNAYCYDILGAFSDVNWGTYFFFGGPGYNVNCQ